MMASAVLSMTLGERESVFAGAPGGALAAAAQTVAPSAASPSALTASALAPRSTEQRELPPFEMHG